MVVGVVLNLLGIDIMSLLVLLYPVAIDACVQLVYVAINKEVSLLIMYFRTKSN